MSQLFRAEALAWQAEPLGQAITWQPPRLRLLMACLCAGTAGALALVLQLEYADKISVPGHVQPPTRPTLIKSMVSGRLLSLSVQEGSLVVAGQVLARLHTGLQLQADLTVAQLRSDGLAQEKRQVGAQIEAVEQRHAAQMVHLDARRAQLAAVERALETRRQVLGEHRNLVEADAERITRLAEQGWIESQAASEVQLNRLMVEDGWLRFQQQWQDVRDQQAALEDEKVLIAAQAKVAVEGLKQQQIRLNAQIALLEAGDEQVVLAPHGGRVALAGIEPGMAVTPETALATLVPDEVERRVELFVPSTGAARILPGMRVRLRFSGFPHQQFGSGTGRVIRIAPAPRLQASGPVYRAEAILDEVPEAITSLPAGMTLDADVVLARQPLWRWLVGPLQSLASRL